VAWPCTPAAVAVVKAIIIIPSPMRANLYALLQCGEDSEYGRKTYGGYIEVFWALVVEDGCDRTTSKMRGFVSQDHIGGFSTKRECANTHK
jgi:glucosinolate gamma-glutamyl hydrolase